MTLVVGKGTKCCGSMPRCRTCPARVASDIRALIGEPRRDVPEHLAGLPPCLHKYEPLLRERPPHDLPLAR